ncbi:uncharacterized protein LOC103697752 [Phoenix dactylifera]|uniref:Uncharacterized protein LOC103697752 n=1 Tax=Phoenix dactylifera TaxID=42345 RepID=A0A8B7BIR8_PHODC|nr:uncharacterized protein LOC103697752 [Phoenix dactylifera]
MSASNLLKLHTPQTTLRSPPPFPSFKTLLSPSHSIPHTQHPHLPLSQKPLRRLTTSSFPPAQELSSSSYSPPFTKEEAISQAKTCLSTTLQKPLSNPLPLPTRKLKKQRQPRYRVEIPVLDESSDSVTQLAFDFFSDFPVVTKKGCKPKILILWSTPKLAEFAQRAFNSADSVINSDLGSVTSEVLSSGDLAVFLAPEASQVEEIKTVTNGLNPKPVVLFNPRWGFEEEKDFHGGMGSFLGSFDVVYSFMGLEVKGVLSKRRGVVFKCVRDGVLSGEGWAVMVEEEGKRGELKVVSRFRRRPSIGEVESVLYNLMAANSLVTKSVKFLRDLASNVTGKKARQ